MAWTCKICKTVNDSPLCSVCGLKAPKRKSSIEEESDSNTTIWICTHCGRPNQGELCMGCGRGCPIASSVSNQPGSYFNLIHGPQGFTAIPERLAKWLSVLILVVFVLIFTSTFLRF